MLRINTTSALKAAQNNMNIREGDSGGKTGVIAHTTSGYNRTNVAKIFSEATKTIFEGIESINQPFAPQTQQTKKRNWFSTTTTTKTIEGPKASDYLKKAIQTVTSSAKNFVQKNKKHIAAIVICTPISIHFFSPFPTTPPPLPAKEIPPPLLLLLMLSGVAAIALCTLGTSTTRQTKVLNSISDVFNESKPLKNNRKNFKNNVETENTQEKDIAPTNGLQFLNDPQSNETTQSSPLTNKKIINPDSPIAKQMMEEKMHLVLGCEDDKKVAGHTPNKKTQTSPQSDQIKSDQKMALSEKNKKQINGLFGAKMGKTHGNKKWNAQGLAKKFKVCPDVIKEVLRNSGRSV